MKKTVITKSQQKSACRSGFCQSLQTDLIGLYSNATPRLSGNCGITYDQR